MSSLPLSIVDVFAETPLAGNQLAVIRDAGALSTEQMQAVAREMNFSETTFVLSDEDERARVRIFTPDWELPFAGHPTLGTAWVIRGKRSSVTLALDAGDVPVTFEASERAWMVPPKVSLGDVYPAARAAELVGLDADDVDDAFPVQVASVGPQFLILPVKDRAALGRASLDGRLHGERLRAGEPVQCVFVFSSEPHHDDAHYSARMFFESAGVREDPATGSANTAFAAYLRAHRGALGDVIVDQGVEMKRPSRLYLDVRQIIRVGGRVQPVVTGTISV